VQPKTVIILAGPTAVGKTGIAVALAGQLNTSIISADSRQCYQGMAIGTAQPSPVQQAAVPHHFINEFPVDESLNAADFERLALGYLEEIFRQHDTAVVCGGTGLYIRALCEGLDEMPAVEERIRKEVEEQYELLGLKWLQGQIQLHDEAFPSQADGANPARLLRALIFKLSTGESIVKYQSAQKKSRPFRILKIGLDLPREVLYNRINHRVDIMMEEGFPEEAKALFPLRHLKNLQTVGYAELFDFIAGGTSLERAVELIKQHTRNYAKRQLTWFRKDGEMHWLQADDLNVTAHILALL
jgi:tRNA dimethylallyltransferase